MSSDWTYLPILKWKQGERRALRELTTKQWRGLVPLAELLAIDAAPDRTALRDALPAYLAKVEAEMEKDATQATARATAGAARRRSVR